jgi:hypothetical protein
MVLCALSARRKPMAPTAASCGPALDGAAAALGVPVAILAPTAALCGLALDGAAAVLGVLVAILAPTAALCGLALDGAAAVFGVPVAIAPMKIFALSARLASMALCATLLASVSLLAPTARPAPLAPAPMETDPMALCATPLASASLLAALTALPASAWRPRRAVGEAALVRMRVLRSIVPVRVLQADLVIAELRRTFGSGCVLNLIK